MTSIDQALRGLKTAEEREKFQQILTELQAHGTSPALEDLVAIDFETEPVDVRTFVQDEHFLNLEGQVWPRLMDDLEEFFHGGPYVEAILKGAIGWGKSYFASLAVLYMVYQCSCLRSPQDYFGLSRGSTISFVNFSVTKKQAKRVVFQEIRSKLHGSPYFRDWFPHAEWVESELRFPKEILISPMSSLETDVLGLNVFGAVIDETNFMPVVERSKMVRTAEAYDAAARIYQAISRRLRSRFSVRGEVPGKIIVVSSSQYPDDFTERKAAEAAEDPKIFVRSYALWEVKPTSAFLPETFRVEVGDEMHGSRLLEAGEAPRPGAAVLEPPLDFKDEFKKDPDAAVRDIGGRTVAGIEPFIRRREAIVQAVDPERKHPFPKEIVVSGSGFPLNVEALCVQADGRWRPRWFPEAVRSAHVDLALTGDAAGVAVGCSPGPVRVVRMNEEGKQYEDVAPLIWYDLLLAVTPPPGGEIDVADIRRLLYRLIELGFAIRKVTYDQFQSAESIQQWKARGIAAEVLSVDGDIRAYEALKQGLYENRVRYYGYRRLQDELRALQVDRRKRKVDHPMRGSKDMADAAAGVAFHWTFAKPQEPRVRVLGERPEERRIVLDDQEMAKAWDGVIRESLEVD